MFGQERLREIDRQQDELVLQSEVHRQVLALESAVWAQRLAWVDSASAAASRLRWWLIPAALIGGVFAMRNSRTLVRWVPLGLSVWKWLQRLRRD